MGCSTDTPMVRACARADRRLAIVAALIGVLVAGCSSVARDDRPAAVEDRTGSQQQAQAQAAEGPQIAAYTPPATPAFTRPAEDAQIAAYTPPAKPDYARPQPPRAVAALTRRAEDQRRAGDLDGAVASLERALRITPEDPLLWQRLAEVRMAQQRPDLVTDLAAKSNALATADDELLRERNWRLIAEARRALGDDGGARAAERAAGIGR